MHIRNLPLVLRDLITQFAWDKKAHETFLLACIATEVNEWGIPDVFIRHYHYDWKRMVGAVSPLVVFNAGIRPCDWFREDVCFLLLQMLDFRRKTVKIDGSRLTWMRRLRDDWTTIVPFSAYYLRLICDKSNWKVCGYSALQNIHLVGPAESRHEPPLIV